MARRVLRSLWLFVPAIAAIALAGCDDPHFDAQQYEIAYTNTAIGLLKGGKPLADPTRYLFTPDYLPMFCGNATTTRGPGDATIEIAWHACTNVPGTDFVGTFEYTSGGIYEGLIDITTEASATGGTPVTFTALLRLEPR